MADGIQIQFGFELIFTCKSIILAFRFTRFTISRNVNHNSRNEKNVPAENGSIERAMEMIDICIVRMHRLTISQTMDGKQTCHRFNLKPFSTTFCVSLLLAISIPQKRGKKNNLNLIHKLHIEKCSISNKQ